MSSLKIDQLAVERQGRTICQVDRLQLQPGERLAVLGPNGSGKTTLLRTIAGLDPQFSGECAVSVPVVERTYVHQQPWMFRGCVLTNVGYGARCCAARIQEIVDQLGLGNLKNQSARRLSGGEMRRVAIARAIAHAPRLLLLDEPIADLDAAATQSVVRLLNTLRETSIVVASPSELPASLSFNSTLRLVAPGVSDHASSLV